MKLIEKLGDDDLHSEYSYGAAYDNGELILVVRGVHNMSSSKFSRNILEIQKMGIHSMSKVLYFDGHGDMDSYHFNTIGFDSMFTIDDPNKHLDHVIEIQTEFQKVFSPLMSIDEFLKEHPEYFSGLFMSREQLEDLYATRLLEAPLSDLNGHWLNYTYHSTPKLELRGKVLERAREFRDSEFFKKDGYKRLVKKLLRSYEKKESMSVLN
jgi:hypothetical protein